MSMDSFEDTVRASLVLGAKLSAQQAEIADMVGRLDDDIQAATQKKLNIKMVAEMSGGWKIVAYAPDGFQLKLAGLTFGLAGYGYPVSIDVQHGDKRTCHSATDLRHSLESMLLSPFVATGFFNLLKREKGKNGQR